MHDQPIIIKKKKAHGHKHHGGSWKVAYADFVTAMMAFFMVMWILGMSPQDKSVIAQYFQDPIGFNKNTSFKKLTIMDLNTKPDMMQQEGTPKVEGADPKQDDEKQMRRIQGAIKDALSTAPNLKKLLEQVEVTLVKEGLRIELVERQHSTFFDSGQATLKPAGQELIGKLAPLIAESERKVIIEGHTDAMPYPGNSYNNWDLSSDRARAVRRALCARGVAPSQLAGEHGYADTRLKDTAHPYAPGNRRVTILLPFSQTNEVKASLPKEELRSHINGTFESHKPEPVRF
jgi:chemotaxis protein MotB